MESHFGQISSIISIKRFYITLSTLYNTIETYGVYFDLIITLLRVFVPRFSRFIVVLQKKFTCSKQNNHAKQAFLFRNKVRIRFHSTRGKYLESECAGGSNASITFSCLVSRNE